MPDITTIATFLGSIKTATEIAKAIRTVDATLAKAELKLKIADLTESLADIKMQAVEIQELLKEKDERIRELESILENKPKMIRHEGKLYESDDQGNLTGDPYCPHCFETKNKSVHLNKIGGSIHVCPACETPFIK